MSNLKKTEAVTGKVRLNYPVLFTPKAMDKNKPEDKKYSCTILLPKSDTATMARIKTAIEEAKKEALSKKWGGVAPPTVDTPIRDGDGVKPVAGTPYGAECKGHYVINANSNPAYPPEVVDLQLNPIIDQSEIYSGVYARVLLNFYPYNHNGKKGISISLGKVQKVEDGEHIASAPKTAADVFGAVEIDPLTGEAVI